MQTKTKRYFSNLLDAAVDFLISRKQRVALNGRFSSWTSIEARVPQGSIFADEIKYFS